MDIARRLIEANGLRQADLVDVFGTPSVVSEVLNGKRNLAKSHIEELSQCFGVSPDLFFEKTIGRNCNDGIRCPECGS